MGRSQTAVRCRLTYVRDSPGAPGLFSLVRSGNIYPKDGRLWDYGQYGINWSSRSYPNTTEAYRLLVGFDVIVVNPSGYSNRWNGFPLRCLAD